jgi:4-hydroxy-tetrahydrodipicolinate synthase
MSYTIRRHVSELEGYMPALPTPFNDEGGIDIGAFRRLCERQINEGAMALVVCGTTGEAPTLSLAEQTRLFGTAAGISRDSVPVIAGAGSNSTAHAIDLAKAAEAAGADAILSVVPYYNKPTQAGLYAHFTAIARSTGLPIILYDVPSRTECGLADETIARLVEMQQFVGLKDATGDVTRPARLRPLVGPDFRLFSGDDATALAFFEQGGDGCISVVSNIAPGLCQSTYLACKQRQKLKALRLAQPVARLTAALFRETNPAPVKYGLSMLGFMSARVRLPLVELGEEARAELATVIAQLCDDHPEQMVGGIHPIQQEYWRAAAG